MYSRCFHYLCSRLKKFFLFVTDNRSFNTFRKAVVLDKKKLVMDWLYLIPQYPQMETTESIDGDQGSTEYLLFLFIYRVIVIGIHLGMYDMKMCEGIQNVFLLYKNTLVMYLLSCNLLFRFYFYCFVYKNNFKRRV